MHWYSKKLNKIYYNKYSALKEDPNVEFRMSHEFDSYDWTIEPPESWDRILKERAQEIRDRYDYLRLWYSGGSDSHTVLNAFLKNNIHLDEISLVRTSPINNFNGISCQEINYVAIPFIKQIQHDIPKTKVVMYDAGFEHFKQYYNSYDLSKNNTYAFRMTNPSQKYKLFPRINNHKNVVSIDGLEKPRVMHDNIGFYWYYSDAIQLTDITTPEEKIFNEHFFLSPRIHCKQCYMVLNAYLDSKICDLYNDIEISKICRDSLYIDFSLGKSTRDRLGVKEIVSINEALSTPESKWFFDKYTDVINTTGIDKKYFNSGELKFGFEGIVTKKYYLE